MEVHTAHIRHQFQVGADLHTGENFGADMHIGENFGENCTHFKSYLQVFVQQGSTYVLKSTSVKKECAKSKKTPKFGAGAIFKNC